MFYAICVIIGLMQDKNSLEKGLQNSVQRNPEGPLSGNKGSGEFPVQLKYRSRNLTGHVCVCVCVCV